MNCHMEYGQRIAEAIVARNFTDIGNRELPRTKVSRNGLGNSSMVS